MSGAIVHSLEPITLVGGAKVHNALLRAAVQLTNGIVAADGGAATVLRAGLTPRAVIGDLDSVSDKVLDRIPPDRLHRIKEQDTTDFDKCLRSIDAPLVIGVGFSGGRVDHHLANINVLVRHADRRCILLGTHDVTFLAPPVLRLDLPRASRVSLFPMGPVTGTSEGLRWPIEGLEFAPEARVGTSNAVSGPVRLAFDTPRMLVILPRAALAETVEALVRQPAGWPAP